FFFFQAEDGIRDFHVTGVQTCALPILLQLAQVSNVVVGDDYIVQVELLEPDDLVIKAMHVGHTELILRHQSGQFSTYSIHVTAQIGRASCRERVSIEVGGVSLEKKHRD